MTQQERIRLARRALGMSQTQLAQAVGVQRSAVSHWEAPLGKNPSVSHMREIALVTGIQFEWLATGRGEMPLSRELQLDSIATARCAAGREPLEFRCRGFRAAPLLPPFLLEVMEELANQRLGRGNGRRNGSAQPAVNVTG